MVIIQIGTDRHILQSLRDVDESWINQQINRRRRDGERVCVQVEIEYSSINMRLATPDCARSGGGGRQANSQERGIFDLWAKHHLNSPDFSGGNLVAFFKQLRRVIDWLSSVVLFTEYGYG